MKLEENNYYHIYHRGVDKRDIFLSETDYQHFLERYVYYVNLAVDTYAYCLLKNHVHFLIRIRPVDEQKQLFIKYKSLETSDLFHGFEYDQFKPYSASSQFGHLFNSYTKYFNKKEERTGVLFDGRFKRIKIESESYLVNMICYIHRNPIHHGISDDYVSYPYSSYSEMITAKKTFISRSKVFELLGDKQNFEAAHDEFKKKLDDKYFIED